MAASNMDILMLTAPGGPRAHNFSWLHLRPFSGASGEPGPQLNPKNFVGFGMKDEAALVYHNVMTAIYTAVPLPAAQNSSGKLTTVRKVLSQGEVFTPLKREAFKKHLAAHLDQSFVERVMNIIEHGADIRSKTRRNLRAVPTC